MRFATQVIFRRITGADFFNIYKAPGTDARGGGQSYIDIDTSGISLNSWYDLFSPVVPEMKTNNFPAWTVKVASIGLGMEQEVTIGQRRQTSVSIRSQKLLSRRSNRIHSWHPQHGGFPAPVNPPNSSHDTEVKLLIDGLVVYFVRDNTGKIWAGWFKQNTPKSNWVVDKRLRQMFDASRGEGNIELEPGIPFDTTNSDWPFQKTPKSNDSSKKKNTYAAKSKVSEEKGLSAFFDDDVTDGAEPKVQEAIRKIRKRNTKAVKKLKSLYNGKCQITGKKYVFKKADGTPYVEAHHLVPLGVGGADSPANLIIISAHMHRMLHYATVSTIDLTKIKENKLNIKINGKSHTVTWHPKHAELVSRISTKKY